MITIRHWLAPVLALSVLGSVAWAAPVEVPPLPLQPVPSAIAVRPAVTVDGPVLHLGDLFTNLGDRASVQIGTTPPPGTQLTVDAATLQRLAMAHKLPWRPASPQERVVVERDSVAVSTDEITAAVLMALMQKGVTTDGLEVELTLGSRQVYRPRAGQLQIDTATVDPSGMRFGAIVAIVAPGEARQTIAITGRLRRHVSLPVLLRPMRVGEVIDAHAVGWAEFPDRQVSTNALREPGRLIGQAARRALAKGAPVLISDVQPAKALAKGQPATLLLELPGMQLTARGVALEDGAVGERIHILNERSKATVQGVVIDATTVRVPAVAVP